MANVFTITSTQQTVKADANRQATAAFTVTNATSRPLRGIIKIRPLGGTQDEWLSVEGESERDFPAGGTHQFTVVFIKPKPATTPAAPQPAENFPFRLDAISSGNPDEDFTEGPVVTVELAEEKVEPKKSSSWWIWAIVGVLLVVGVIAAILLSRGCGTAPPPPPTPVPSPPPAEKVEVANVAGKTYAEAEKELAAQKLKAEKVVVRAPDKEADKVFSQQPEAKSSVEVNSTVKLSVPDTCNKESRQCVWLPQYLYHTAGKIEGNGGWAIAPFDPRPAGHFLYGPYFSLQEYGAGQYRVFWEMKVDDNTKDADVAVIDIFSLQPAPKGYAQKVIKARDFYYPNAAQQFTLDFVVTEPSLKYEFRVVYAGNVKLTVEKIGFQKL